MIDIYIRNSHKYIWRYIMNDLTNANLTLDEEDESEHETPQTKDP